MTGAGAVRAVCSAVVLLLAAVTVFYCVLIGIWIYTSAGSPGVSTGDLLWPAAGLGVVTLLAFTAVLVQLSWANRATTATAVALRSLPALVGPVAVILVIAVAV